LLSLYNVVVCFQRLLQRAFSFKYFRGRYKVLSVFVTGCFLLCRRSCHRAYERSGVTRRQTRAKKRSH